MPIKSIGTVPAVYPRHSHFVMEAMKEPIKYPSSFLSMLKPINGYAVADAQEENRIAMAHTSKAAKVTSPSNTQ